MRIDNSFGWLQLYTKTIIFRFTQNRWLNCQIHKCNISESQLAKALLLPEPWIQKQRLSEEVSNLNPVIEETRIEAEKAKKELIQVRHRETELEKQLAQLKKQLQKKMAPVLVVSKPKDGVVTKFPSTNLQIVAVDDNGISDLNVFINNSPLELTGQR